MARAAELITESWTLLIVRELLRGDRSAAEISQCIPAVSPGVLSARLSRLQRANLITRIAHPSQHPSYQLTAAGLELRPVIDQLGAWGQRWLSPPRGAELASTLLITDIVSELDRSGLPSQPVCIRIVLTDTSSPRHWWLVLSHSKAVARTDDPGIPVAVEIISTLSALTDIWLGNSTWLQEVKSSLVRLRGSRDMVRATIGWLGVSRFARVQRAEAPLPRM